MVELLWNKPPSRVTLEGDDVHVWSVDLDQPPARVKGLLEYLSSDEQARAGEFKQEQGRNNYIVGRGMLRQLLGRYLNVEPATPAFQYNANGKPTLAGPAMGVLHFNVSHSAGLALIAFTRICSLGVDVERVRPMNDAKQIARRFFTPRESASLDSVLESGQPTAFFSLWTRKEAWLKANGLGVPGPLHQVEMSFLPGEPARILDYLGLPGEADKWALTALNPAAGFIGALAIRSPRVKVSVWRWDA